MTSALSYWHGGAPGLPVGALITPGHERKLHDGCPYCEARAKGQAVISPLGAVDPPSGRPDRVYITTDRLYAKHYASLYGRGWLYRVEPVGDVEPSPEDSIPTWLAEAARVVAVYERAVQLTDSERRRLWRAWSDADAARGWT